MMDLSDRKKKILQAVIDEYIGTAEPVGSRAVSKNSALKLSSATIRNEMSDLEEMGFLIQPHTSAGRIPSDEGYRFYVNSLMERYQMGMEAVMELQKAFQMHITRLDQIIKYAGRIASALTDYAAIVTSPERSVSKIRKFDLVPMAHDKTMLLAVTDVVLSQLMNISLSLGGCETAARILNAALSGLTADDITPEMKREITGKLAKAAGAETAEIIMETAYDIVARRDNEQDVYISNEKSILKYP
ncbi:MAG: heat-inducible transcriptional repressor HrcA [Firmicutes bacterium]|nr:heat-inducible transcriptional repressor HrcA [Bacillota bacterium]